MVTLLAGCQDNWGPRMASVTAREKGGLELFCEQNFMHDFAYGEGERMCFVKSYHEIVLIPCGVVDACRKLEGGKP